jgi:uridylate kinase
MIKKRETIVISLGGSMIINGTGVHVAFLKKFRSIISAESKKGLSFVIVCGGGNTARVYQAGGREFKFADKQLDEIGIRATHVNAEFVRAMFVGNKKVFVFGGEKPGQSTDAVSVRHAIEMKGTHVINISSTAFVYDKDPGKFPDAVRYDSLTWKQYRAIVGSKWVPGMHAPFDPIAARMAEKHKIDVSFMGGNDLGALTKILRGKKWGGTKIA